MGNLPLDIPDENIQQWTGRQDRDGNEIYEGDVLRSPDSQSSATVCRDNNGDWSSKEWACNPIWEYWTIVGNNFGVPCHTK